MKNNWKIFMVMLTGVLVIMAACGNSSEESNAISDNTLTNSSSAQSGEVSSNEDLADENTINHPSDSTDNTKLNDHEETSNHRFTNLTDSESMEPTNGNGEMTEINEDEYLKKLNEMEEADRLSEAGTTIVDLEEQESERYQKWDVELNEVYRILKETLSKEQMDQLKEEQRNWIIHRDEVAKEESLKYKDGSTEALEYVATQASLTRERCYELIARYMK
ncbi:lysozyme inhibitor LprI family protein [Pseudogracilibacillus auburnensis]|uniref:lysozyme inhibitor LprI family protein n=1 Tax=Pseudogracilibacillus auburnensis TaxID=1494959 RepID=UPI001A95E931|nr:lysozyme inhibitor LprI family protein [Pseudogracilibacillus auburnensis]MBO1005930.1 DUF1311 domain-containing protein [Pseudogracilibacillus auburnensis]